jgi:tetratricopeptide (TPR) repeat protein
MSKRISFLVIAVLSTAQAPYLSAQTSLSSGGDYDARLEKGVDLYSRSKYVEAEVFFSNLAKAVPDRKEAYLWLGHTLAKQGKLPQARAAFQRYSELAPNDAEGLIATARTYDAEGNKDLAKLWYKKAQDRDPDNEQAHQALRQIENGQAANAPKTNAPPQSEPADSPAGFWRVGLAGVTGARTVWWGRAIVLLVMIGSVLGGWNNMARLREQNPFMPAAMFYISALLASPLWYVILWGVPTALNWAWLGAFTVTNLFGVAAAMNAAAPRSSS